MGSPTTSGLPPPAVLNTSSVTSTNYLPLEDRNVLVAGPKGCGKTSLVFTLARGIFPGKSAPGRFEGWSITAVATPKDLLNEVHSKGKASKPYFVNLTFWEDRPRLNLWEEIIQQRRKLEEEAAKKEAQIKKEKSQRNSLAIISLERNSSSVGYSTVNGITTPNYKAKVAMGKPPTGKKKFEEKVSSTILTSSSSASNKEQQLDEMTLCLTTRPYTHPEPDVIVLCYSATDLTSFNEVETIIWPELRDKFPYVPIILVATKCDAREKDPAIEEFWHMDSGDSPNKNSPPKFATMEMGNALAHRINANAYIECSALENRGLRHIVEEAVWILNSAVIAASEATNAILSTEATASSLNNGSRKWSLSSSYPSSKSTSAAKLRKSSHSLSRTPRKISTTSTVSTGSGSGSYSCPRPHIFVQDPFSTNIPSSIVASAGRSGRKQSYGAAVRKILQNVTPKQ